MKSSLDGTGELSSGLICSQRQKQLVRMGSEAIRPELLLICSLIHCAITSMPPSSITPCEGLKAMMYQTLLEIQQLIYGFQNCTLPRDLWTHAAHLTVASWYLLNNSFDSATAQIREGIQRYNAAMKLQTTRNSGYHETITLFWIHIIHQFLSRQNQQESVLNRVNALIQACNDPNLPFQYYSRDRLLSWEARTSWLKPDLTPLDQKQLNERI